MNKKLLLVLGGAALLPACQQGTQSANETDQQNEMLDYQPNIVWISCEDIGCYLKAYGDSTINTPNIDRLVEEGILYENAFTIAGVCAPSRSSIITGMYPSSLGTHNMRTWGARLPEKIKCFTEYMREADYFCTNNLKEDYNFDKPEEAWDESSSFAHWKHRPKGKPFFSVFNLIITHESRIWMNAWDIRFGDSYDPPIPPYYPQDNEIVKSDVSRNYSNIVAMDAQVGVLMAELERAKLLDSTIVIFWSDHGGPLPRQKRELYDSGLKVPLIVRFPDGRFAGTRRDDMVSLMDLGPTMLSLIGVEPPEHMFGRPFLGKFKAEPREYIYAARDRMDNEYDMVRAVRNKQYKYFRNYHPEKPYRMNINYRLQMPMMRELMRLYELDSLGETQKLWFRESKPVEELYDITKDPHEINNLAADPAYADVLKTMREAHEEWCERTMDVGIIPEVELFEMMARENKPIYTIVREKPDLLKRARETASLWYQPTPNMNKLHTALQDPEPTIRYWAAIGLGNIPKKSEPYKADLKTASRDSSAVVRIAAGRALCRMDDWNAGFPVLKAALEHEDARVVVMVLYYFIEMKADAKPALPIIEQMTQHENSYVVREAENALAIINKCLEKE